jgi:hypothetical protein
VDLTGDADDADSPAAAPEQQRYGIVLLQSALGVPSVRRSSRPGAAEDNRRKIRQQAAMLEEPREAGSLKRKAATSTLEAHTPAQQQQPPRAAAAAAATAADAAAAAAAAAVEHPQPSQAPAHAAASPPAAALELPTLEHLPNHAALSVFNILDLLSPALEARAGASNRELSAFEDAFSVLSLERAKFCYRQLRRAMTPELDAPEVLRLVREWAARS